MDESQDWKTLAIEKQMQFFETLGSRSYDEIEKTNLFLLRKKVGFATCGKPKELPSSSNLFIGYDKKDLKQIKMICDKIIEKSDYDPIRFACSVLILYHKSGICETSVFRIESKAGDIFIDAHGRVYQSWKHFMKENKLPDCEYCYPQEGKYTEKEAVVGFTCSPASSLISKTTDYLDTAGTVASLAAASVFAAGTFLTVAPAVVTVAGASAACTGLYSVSRNVSSLFDRKKHEQSVGLEDPESRSAWLGVGSSVVGVLTFGAIGKAQKVVESGKSLSKASIFGLHALTTSSLVFSGFGFVETLVICVDKYKKGVLTKKDVFDLSCELLFLFNAIASAKATTNLVNSMSATVAAETPAVQKKLTKTQKRNLRKRAAKRKAKGLPSHTDTSSDSTIGTTVNTTIKLLLLEAVKLYSPRAEEIMYNCQSIYHDILCWKRNEINDSVFMSNAFQRMLRLFNDYKDEIAEAMVKMVKYFSSFNLNKTLDEVYSWFCEASEELKNIFCTKVINLEDQIEALISDAEKDVTNLLEELGVNLEESIFENSLDNSEDLDEDDFSSETQNLLSACGNIISVSALSCRDLEDFGDILDAVKYIVVSEFKTKISNYKKSLEAAKAASGDSFDVITFHKTLGVNGDVGQHMFTETMHNLTAGSTIYKIKNKCKEIEKERSNRSIPIWEGVNDGMFHYYGPHGRGNLSRSDLLTIINGIVTEADVTEETCRMLEDKDTLMIEVKVPEMEDINVVVYQGVTEENTASGIIVVMK